MNFNEIDFLDIKKLKIKESISRFDFDETARYINVSVENVLIFGGRRSGGHFVVGSP